MQTISRVAGCSGYLACTAQNCIRLLSLHIFFLDNSSSSRKKYDVNQLCIQTEVSLESWDSTGPAAKFLKHYNFFSKLICFGTHAVARSILKSSQPCTGSSTPDTSSTTSRRQTHQLGPAWLLTTSLPLLTSRKGWRQPWKIGGLSRPTFPWRGCGGVESMGNGWCLVVYHHGETTLPCLSPSSLATQA